jgi:hypothetical protein
MPRRRILHFVSGLAFLVALLLPTAPAASANTPPYPWNVDTYDYGNSPGSFTFVFTNIYPWPLVDKPAPMQDPEAFRVLRDTCTAPVSPGGSCNVTVAYAAQGKPVADALQLLFDDPAGEPVATPSVRLFGGGAEYLTVDYLGGIVIFPDTSPGTEYDLRLIFHIHGPGPIDLPPDLVAPWTVIGNTCGSLKPGATSCQLGIAFKPTTAGTFTTRFRMPFTDPLTQQPVSVPVVTLQGTAR